MTTANQIETTTTAQLETITQKINAVNVLLLQQEPGNISFDSHGGYYGYKPQSIIDSMNQIFGPCGFAWGFEEVSHELMGDSKGVAVVQVKVWLEGIKTMPTAWGQGRVTRGDIGDSYKSGQTDGIKKCLSYFSIGNRAYLGLLEAVYKAAEAAEAKAKAAAAAAERKAAAAANAARNQNNSRPAQPNTAAPAPAVATLPQSKPAATPAQPVKETPAAEQKAPTIEEAIEKRDAQPVRALAESMQIKNSNGLMPWPKIVAWAYTEERKKGTKKGADLERRANAGQLTVEELKTVHSKLLELKAQRAAQAKQAQPVPASNAA